MTRSLYRPSSGLSLAKEQWEAINALLAKTADARKSLGGDADLCEGQPLHARYRPGRSNVPLPDGDGMVRGSGPVARDQREAIEAMLTDPEEAARVIKPLHATGDQYEVLVAERMRTMTLAERIDIEIALTQRFRRIHTFDYDPLRY